MRLHAANNTTKRTRGVGAAAGWVREGLVARAVGRRPEAARSQRGSRAPHWGERSKCSSARCQQTE